MKYYELTAMREVLKKLDVTKDLPVKVGFAIVKNERLIADHLKAYDEMRNKIISKYADDTGSVSADKDPDKFKACMHDIGELDSQETDPINFTTIKLADIEDLSMNLNELNALYFMIEERENTHGN